MQQLFSKFGVFPQMELGAGIQKVEVESSKSRRLLVVLP